MLLSLFLTNFKNEKDLSHATCIVDKVTKYLCARNMVLEDALNKLYLSKVKYTQTAQFLQILHVVSCDTVFITLFII